MWCLWVQNRVNSPCDSLSKGENTHNYQEYYDGQESTIVSQPWNIEISKILLCQDIATIRILQQSGYWISRDTAVNRIFHKSRYKNNHDTEKVRTLQFQWYYNSQDAAIVLVVQEDQPPSFPGRGWQIATGRARAQSPPATSLVWQQQDTAELQILLD